MVAAVGLAALTLFRFLSGEPSPEQTIFNGAEIVNYRNIPDNIWFDGR